MNTENIAQKHISVLLDELVYAIWISKDKKNVIVDCTLGMWWHAVEIINKLNSGDILIWFDADIKNLELARQRLDTVSKEKWVDIILINSNFVQLKEELTNKWIEKITWIYYDLWLSSLHLDEADRWFSFMLDGPLDMRLNKSHGKKASDIVNSYTQADLRKIFLEYWEESGANKIAARIVEARRKQKFTTTAELSEIIPGWPKTKARIFQALRIETNKELDNLETSLNDAIDLLDSGGNIFVISFHSLEDRIVKQKLKRETKDCICSDLICSCHHKKSLKILTKKPILPSEEEIKKNPRSRSAKARHALKI